jgi:hypothetical protein
MHSRCAQSVQTFAGDHGIDHGKRCAGVHDNHHGGGKKHAKPTVTACSARRAVAQQLLLPALPACIPPASRAE